ncbi:MAG: hypothetical protein QOI63_560, partial [Thermoplasmata archaeon]|nr:hypothetical protein [Thermoplasmata archaeon]
MKLPLPQQRRNAIAFVAILLVATLAPIGFSSQIERLVQGIVRPPGPVPDGGDVGEGIAKVLTNLDPVLARVERIVAYLEDLGRVGNPNPTSPYFLDFQFDRGEQARRLGGWGDWAGSKGWVADPRAPRAPGSLHGVTFGSNQTASYPIGPQAQSSFLVSPRISLRSLPMPQLATPGTPAGSALPATVGGGDAEGQPDSLRLTGEGAAQDGYTRAGAAATGVAGQAPEGSLVVPAIQQGLDSGQGVVTAEQGVGLTTGVADPHRILLTLTHRYNFGFVYRPVAGQVGGGLDGGRVEAFTHAPTADDLRGGGQVLTPLAASYQPTAAFAGGGAFTGSSLNLTQDQFDLTALAGQDVWLVFHAATNPWARSATAYFANGNYFNTMLPGRGWTLNQVQVEGPAFLDNVRIDQVLKPDFPDGAADRYKAAEGANDFAMLLLNRGLRDEAVLPSLDLTREGGEKATCTLPPLSPPLRPGEVRRVTFPASACPAEDLAHGTNYTVAFHAAVPGADGFPSDNDVGGLNVRTLPSPDVVPDGLPLLTPALGDGNTHRRVTMPLRNPGFGDASVLATILVQRVDPEGRVVAEVTQSAVQGRSGQPVPGPGGDDPHAMTLVIPGDAADVANHLSAAWDLLLPQGRYNVTVEARMAASGHSIQDAFLLHASTLVAEPDPYSIDFADPFATPIDAALANRTAAPWNQWTTRSWIDTPPPQCETPSQDPGPWSPCPGKIWEVTGQADAPQSTAAVTYVLSGTFASVPAQTRFTSLQVDVQHQMQDLNCGPVGAGASCNANTVPGPAAIGLTQLSPAAPTSAGQPSDQAAQALGNVQKVNWAIGPHIGSTRADINGNTATVNRFMELDGQWMRESRTFTQGFTGAQLQEMALQFQLDMVGSGGSTGSCPQPGFQSYCPTWRVSYVNVVGTTDAGERIVLLRLNGAPAPGDDGSDVGGWATFVQIDRANFKAQTGPTSAQPFQDCLTRLDPAHPEQATTCRGWQGRDLALHPLVPPASPWAHGDLLALGTAQGVWSTADPAQPRMDYAPRQRGLLVSPALLVPADALDPHLFISHLFQFGSSSIADVTNTDGGTLMVRFLDDPADLHPVSPFMPVAVQYNATAGRPLDPFKPQRYTGTDCDFYYNQQFI